jgi:hypothetical protein
MNKNDFLSIVIVTSSMEPILPVGSRHLVDGSRVPQIGDVIVYNTNEKAICHLLIQISPQGYLCSGLQSLSPDLLISLEFIQGVVVNVPWTFWEKIKCLWRWGVWPQSKP